MSRTIHSAGYDIFKNPVCWSHRAVYDVTGSMKSGDLQASVRERYIHAWSPAIGTQSNELRSLLKVQYNIPDSAFHPYLSAEVFTWGTDGRRRAIMSDACMTSPKAYRWSATICISPLTGNLPSM